MRLKVPFGRHNSPVVGYLLGLGETLIDDERLLKPVSQVLDSEPLISSADCAILQWASRYYHHPVGEVFATAFPVLLRQGHSAVIKPDFVLCLTDAGKDAQARIQAPRQARLLELLRAHSQGASIATLNDLGWNWRASARSLIGKGWARFREIEGCEWRRSANRIESPPEPNPAQRRAIDAVLSVLGEFRAFLLEGVTGSGKTEVYLRLVEAVLATGAQAMILLPEINLTPQLEARFRARFAAPVVVFHSGLTDQQRRRAWLEVQGGKAAILLGTRSAVFMPLARPGLIILDEEHDPSFKQQEGFRFSARDVAVMRARQLSVPIILGSATPSLETLFNVKRGRYTHLSLPERTGASVQPTFRVVDVRNQRLNEGLSSALIAQIEATIARKEQVLLFLNRRGYAPTLICHVCGWVAECNRCDARLVLHSAEHRLLCHHCGHEQVMPCNCPECCSAALLPLGLGTERVEYALARIFPNATTLRLDRDSTRQKGNLERMLDEIQTGRIDVILGTQMLAKGHHFPNVTLVGILDVDGGLFSLDFRASERIAQLIIQVAGRAGRGERPGTVLLQTRQPEHPLLRKLIREGYGRFAEAALEERLEAGLPPYSHQALWRADANEPDPPTQFLSSLSAMVDCHGEVLALGPVPAPRARLAGRWRSQLLLQSAHRNALHRTIEHLLIQIPKLPDVKRVRWSVDIDPVDLY